MDLNRLLDICIPTRNRADYLDGLLHQISEAITEYALGDLVGVVVSDNCSDDDTANILERWAGLRKDWRMSRTELNIGADANCQRLIQLSKADYVWILGDDDEFVGRASLTEVIGPLRDSEIDLLLLTETPDGPHDAGDLVFDSARQFFTYALDNDPSIIQRATWISANVFRREMLQALSQTPRLAEQYQLSYDIWNGVRKSKQKILVKRTPIVRPRKVAGKRDAGAFPTQKRLMLEWRLLYCYLARKFRQPKLNKYSIRWKAAPPARLQQILGRSQ